MVFHRFPFLSTGVGRVLGWPVEDSTGGGVLRAMTTVFRPSLEPSSSARHWRVQWANVVVPAENDDGKSDGGGFSPINALLPLSL